MSRLADGALSGGEPLALAVLDLDHFKAVNDRHGHLAGDEVLRRVGARLGMAPVDLAARWGGEEFLLVLPGTDANGAVRLAERIRTVLEARTLLTPEGVPVSVTASFGVAALDEATPEELVAAADDALYEAKRDGRNKVSAAASSLRP